MSYDFVELGPVPSDEPAAQIPDQTELNKAEVQIYRRQLERQFPIPEALDAYYGIKANPHEFGTYREVAVFYNENDRAAADLAYSMEDGAPTNWDEPAKAELDKWKAKHGMAVPA